MAAPKSQRDNADAFDDLLGQLVDELAMTPTMVPEPEPEPEPEPPPPAPIQEVYHAPIQEAPPPRSNMMPIAIGGGIAVAGIALALMLGRGDPPKPVEPAKPVIEAKKDVTPTPPVPAQPVPGQPIPGQPGQPGQPGMAQPGVAQPGLNPDGTPATGVLPGDPAAVPGTPGAVIPPTEPAKPTTNKKPVKKSGGGSSGGGTKKAEPTKKKPGEVVDPFG